MIEGMLRQSSEEVCHRDSEPCSTVAADQFSISRETLFAFEQGRTPVTRFNRSGNNVPISCKRGLYLR